MARSRYIKPGLCKNETLAECDPLARFLFAVLSTIADREGRLEDRPRRIKAELLPYDDCDIDSLLMQLADRGFIVRYTIGTGRYIQIVNFLKHQSPHANEPPSELPSPQALTEVPKNSEALAKHLDSTRSSNHDHDHDFNSNLDIKGPCSHGAASARVSTTVKSQTDSRGNGVGRGPVDLVQVGEIEGIAERVFEACGYSGTEGKNLWKAAAALHLGKISEHELFDSCAAAKMTDANNPPAVVYTRLEEMLDARGLSVQEVFKLIRISPRWPKTRPKPKPTAASVLADRQRQLADARRLPADD